MFANSKPAQSAEIFCAAEKSQQLIEKHFTKRKIYAKIVTNKKPKKQNNNTGEFMKKKTRIIGSISALALSMAMLTGGVLAASQVSLNVSSTVSFNAQGVYLKAEGQVKRGANEGSLSNLTTSANYTYTGYSYNPDASGEPDGTSYTNTAMRDQAGSTVGWQIGEVEFTETEKVLQYAITFTNYSEFDVSITITPDVAASLTGVTTSSSGNEITVAAKSGETLGTASYTFTMTLNNFSSSVDGAVSLDINAEKATPAGAPAEVPDSSSISYTITINNTDTYNNQNIDTLFLKEGDTFKISASRAEIFVYLYNASDIEVDSWHDLNSVTFEVPALSEGYYFSIVLSGYHAGGGAA